MCSMINKKNVNALNNQKKQKKLINQELKLHI